VLPVPDGGGGYTEASGYVFLEQTEFKTTVAQVIAESDGI